MTPRCAAPDCADLLGPAALDLLTGPEQRRLDAHLAGCAMCSAELAGLRVAVGRLASLDEVDLLALGAEAGNSLLVARDRSDAVLAAVAAEGRLAGRQVQRRQRLLAAAASLVVLASGLTVADALRPASSPVLLEAVAVQGDVVASADLVAHTWGVEIKLAATGLAAGQAFRVQVRTDDGRTIDAGAFLGTGPRTVHCNLNASVLRADAASFAVLDGSGRPVLTAAL